MNTKISNKIQALIDHYGGVTAASRALGVSQPTVSAWLYGTHGISVKNAFKIQARTGGAFKASDLCPDLMILDPENAA